MWECGQESDGGTVETGELQDRRLERAKESDGASKARGIEGKRRREAGSSVPASPIFLAEYDHSIDTGQVIVMHQIGGFVPPRTRLPIYEKIYSKITTVDSLRARKSAFLSDVLQISEIYKFGGANAILLMDEFGRGTNVYEGAALYKGILMCTRADAIVCARGKSKAGEIETEGTASRVTSFREKYEEIRSGRYVVAADNTDEWATAIINDYLLKRP